MMLIIKVKNHSHTANSLKFGSNAKVMPPHFPQTLAYNVVVAWAHL